MFARNFLQTFEELPEIRFQRPRKSREVVETYISHSTFELSDVRPLQSGSMCERLLREAEFTSPTANTISKLSMKLCGRLTCRGDPSSETDLVLYNDAI